MDYVRATVRKFSSIFGLKPFEQFFIDLMIEKIIIFTHQSLIRLPFLNVDA
jgi:hypothetical protein